MTPGPGAAPDVMVGGFVLLLGALALWQTGIIPASPIYAQVGPKAVPYVVGAGLLALGAALLATALRGGWSHTLEEVAEAPPTNWRALALLLAGLVVNLVLIGPSASRSRRRCSSCWWRGLRLPPAAAGPRHRRWC